MQKRVERRRKAKAAPKPVETPLVLWFGRDAKSGERVAVANTLHTYRYVITKRGKGRWLAEVFTLLRPTVPGRPGRRVSIRANWSSRNP